MLILGLLLIAAAGVAVIGAVFFLDGEVSYLGSDMDAFALFLVGAVTVAVFVVGMKLAGFGARRELRQRREHRRLTRRNEKLEKFEQDRAEE